MTYTIRHAHEGGTLIEGTERVQARAAAAWERSEAAVRSLPSGGEPIKVGHHSEGRHRRALERARLKMGAQLASTDDQLAYWREVRESQVASPVRRLGWGLSPCAWVTWYRSRGGACEPEDGDDA